MSEHYQLSVGRPSPFPSLISAGLGGSLVVDASIPMLVIMAARPSQSDIDLVGTGSVDVGLIQEGQSAILVWRFASPGKEALYIETPLNIGLEAPLRDFPNLSVKGLATDEERGAAVVLQDETGIVRLIRPIIMPRPILNGLAPLLVRQIAYRGTPKLMRRHARDLESYYARMRCPSTAYDQAPIKSRAA